MRRMAMVTAAVLGLSLSPALAAMDAQEFVDKAYTGGMFETQTSRMALHLSGNAAVRDFARQMIADHTKANADLKAIAEAADLKLPVTLDPERQDSLEALKSAGDAFPGRYVAAQQKDHRAAIALFERYLAEGGNPQLKGFARQVLPTLKQHQAAIDAIAATNPAN
jgi:putative membrane protein